MDRFEFYCKLPRCEPGGATFTSAYLTHFPIKAPDTVLDLGCASGGRATWIARSRGCRVVAVDRDPRYLPYVQRRAAEGGSGHLVLPVAAEYGRLPFGDARFKFVLAEGAAWSLGLKQALTVWRRLLVPQGLLAVTYPGVVNKDATAQVRGPLERRMAEPLGTLASYHQEARAAGFEVIHQVSLQHALWDAHYTDTIRHAWGLNATTDLSQETGTLADMLAEARWFRRVGRGRVFLQALVLKRVR